MEAARKRIDLYVGYVDDTLASHPHIAGDQFIIADIAMYWNLWIGRCLEAIPDAAFPHVAAYMTRLEQRPTHAKAMAIPEGFVRQMTGTVHTPLRGRTRVGSLAGA